MIRKKTAEKTIANVLGGYLYKKDSTIQVADKAYNCFFLKQEAFPHSTISVLASGELGKFLNATPEGMHVVLKIERKKLEGFAVAKKHLQTNFTKFTTLAGRYTYIKEVTLIGDHAVTFDIHRPGYLFPIRCEARGELAEKLLKVKDGIYITVNGESDKQGTEFNAFNCDEL